MHSNSTSFSNATSVPGRRHTATFGSPTAAKPPVIVNFVETNLSPTFASREGTPLLRTAKWIAARLALLAKEKEFTRTRDRLSQERRDLPWERVKKRYAN